MKIDPKSRQMERYLFNGEGKPLTNGKKEPFEELVRKCSGTPVVGHPRLTPTGLDYVEMINRVNLISRVSGYQGVADMRQAMVFAFGHHQKQCGIAPLPFQPARLNSCPGCTRRLRQFPDPTGFSFQSADP